MALSFTSNVIAAAAAAAAAATATTTTTTTFSSSLLLFSPPTFTCSTHHWRLRRRLPISASATSPADRVLSAAVYLYPFLDGASNGRFLAAQLPILRPILPFSRAFHLFPFSSLAIFFCLYLGVVRNPNSFSRFVRFNAMQAIVLDVLLIFPELLENSLGVRGGLGLDLLMSVDSTVFLYLLVCLLYGSTSCLAGELPRLPLVADAADSQVM